MAATLFIRSPKGARLDKEKKILHLSAIFQWYKKDFEKASGSVVDFLKKYMREEDSKFIDENLSDIEISYKEYDWGLNIAS